MRRQIGWLGQRRAGLEPLDLTADRTRRDAELGRGTLEAFVARRDRECAQGVEWHALDQDMNFGTPRLY